MRWLSLVALLLLASCVSSGDGTIIVQPGISQTSTVQGEGTFGSVTVSGFPFTYPIRWSGSGTITLQYPAQPYVVLAGELDWIVEPFTPSDEPAVRAAMARGEVVICGGRLMPSGTIAARKNR